MGKKYFLLVFFVCISSVMGFAFDYWWLDVFVDSFSTNLEPNPSTQRAYFFRDLNSLQEATGFPHGERFYWISDPKWRDNPQLRFEGIIFNTMQREGFSYAFIMTANGVEDRGQNRNRRYYTYAILSLRNGREYTARELGFDTPIVF